MDKGRFYPNGKINCYHPDVRNSTGTLKDVVYAYSLLGTQAIRQVVKMTMNEHPEDFRLPRATEEDNIDK